MKQDLGKSPVADLFGSFLTHKFATAELISHPDVLLDCHKCYKVYIKTDFKIQEQGAF